MPLVVFEERGSSIFEDAEVFFSRNGLHTSNAHHFTPMLKLLKFNVRVLASNFEGKKCDRLYENPSCSAKKIF